MVGRGWRGRIDCRRLGAARLVEDVISAMAKISLVTAAEREITHETVHFTLPVAV
jgi:ribose 5-phosphate isomerase